MLRIKLFLILFLSSLLSSSQSNVALVKKNATWVVEYWYDFSPPSGHEVYKIFIEDDTVINNLDYKFIYQHKWDSLVRIKNKKMIRLIREDTISQKTYIIYLDGSTGSTNDSLEWLLYDFSVKAGDTIKYDTLPLNHVHSGIYRCDSIDTMNISGQARRVFYFTRNIPFGKDIWIEGIGSIELGFFGPHFEEFESTYQTSCYWDQQIFWRSDTTRSCAVLSIEQTEKKEQTLQVFPMPVKNTLYISGLNSLNSYKLLNLEGRTILSGLFKSDNQINFSTVQHGFYLLLIENSKGDWNSFKVLKD